MSSNHGALLKMLSHSAKVALFIIILWGGYIGYQKFSAMKKAPKEKSEERLARTLLGIRVTAENIRLTASGYGTAEPATRVRISPQLDGKITAVNNHFDDGALVGKGETLVEIDKEDYEIALKEATAEIDRLKAELAANEQDVKDAELILETVARDLDLERKDFERIKALREKDVISESSFDQAAQDFESKKNLHITGKGRVDRLKIQRRSIEAQIEMAVARKQKAELNIRRAVLHSPFDGRLENVEVEEGDYVTVGKVVCDVVNDAELEIPVSISAFEAYQVLELKSCGPHGYDNWIECAPNTTALIKWNRDANAYRWRGKVLRVENLNPSTRTLTFIVTPTEYAGAAKNELPLITGMFCDVDLEGKTLADAFRIPLSAIQFNGLVFVADQAGTLTETPVTIVKTIGEDVIVSSGLKDGDIIITQQIPRGIVNGTRVNVINRQGTTLTEFPPPAAKTTITKPDAREATSNG